MEESRKGLPDRIIRHLHAAARNFGLEPDEETIATIREVKNRTGYLMDPHTAVGYLGARRFLDAAGDGRKIITLSTAHPGKFQEMVAEALGSAPELPERLKGLLDLPKRAEKIGGTLEDLKEVLLSRHG